MIGMVTTGKSFYHCISYCLEDKVDLSEQKKIDLSRKEQVQHKDRAEVLAFNNCFGNKNELTSQFSDVRKLNSRVEKPVLHLSLRLAPGETLSKSQLAEIGHALAKEFKVDQNQYICVLHKDTREQHIHLVANRVGYDGKVASDSNSYIRIANLCRRLEKEYHLKQVLNPRQFLPKEQRQIPRQDIRKEQLKENIRQTLWQVDNYDQFEQKMKSLGYQVLKGRGISFIDDKKVKIKGSEVGFSLMKIERILEEKQKWILQQKEKETRAAVLHKDREHARSYDRQNNREKAHEKDPVHEKEFSFPGKYKGSLLEELLKPEERYEPIDPELLKTKRKKERHGLEL